MGPLMSISMANIAAAAAAAAETSAIILRARAEPTNISSSSRFARVTLIITSSIVCSLLFGCLVYYLFKSFQKKRRARENERKEVIEARQMKDTDQTLKSRYSMIDLGDIRLPTLKEVPTPKTSSVVSLPTVSQSIVPERKNSVPVSPYFQPGIKRSRSAVAESRRAVLGISPPAPTYTRKTSEPNLRVYAESDDSFQTFGFDTYSPQLPQLPNRMPEVRPRAYNPSSRSASVVSVSTRKFKSTHADLSPRVYPVAFRFPPPAIKTTTETGRPIQRSQSDSKLSSSAAALLLSRTLKNHAAPAISRDDVDQDEDDEEERITPLENYSKDMTEEEQNDNIEAWLDGAPSASNLAEASQRFYARFRE